MDKTATEQAKRILGVFAASFPDLGAKRAFAAHEEFCEAFAKVDYEGIKIEHKSPKSEGSQVRYDWYGMWTGSLTRYNGRGYNLRIQGKADQKVVLLEPRIEFD